MDGRPEYATEKWGTPECQGGDGSGGCCCICPKAATGCDAPGAKKNAEYWQAMVKRAEKYREPLERRYGGHQHGGQR